MTLIITTFSIMSLSLTTFGIITLIITIFKITELSIKGLFVPMSINDHYHKNTLYIVSLC